MFPRGLRVIETHPGGGQYDCLAIFQRNDPYKGARIDLNRLGSAHVLRDGETRSWREVWSSTADPNAIREAASRLGTWAEFPVPPPGAMPDQEDVSVAELARMLSQHQTDDWDCRNGYFDSSEGSGRRLEWFAMFPDAQERLRIPAPDALFNEPAYGFWFLLKDDLPFACIEAATAQMWSTDGELRTLTRESELSKSLERSIQVSTDRHFRVRIHRGSQEIGGNCVELEAAGKRIVLDVGRPLSATRGEVIPLPEVSGFHSDDNTLLALIISHGHQDHWGLVGQLPETVPIVMGKAAHHILIEAAFFTEGMTRSPWKVLKHREPLDIGPFKITPYLNDHSGFDAYSLLIEACGKRLFYSGDLQGHGRKAGIFKELLRRSPDDVDVMLMEGTHVQDSSSSSRSELTEKDVESTITATIKATVGLVLAYYSAQNIDRMVTFYRAAKRSGRTLILDLYGASVAAATGNLNIPQPGEEWPVIKVYVPLRQAVRVKESGEFERVENIKPYRIFPEEICANPNGYVLTFRGSMIYEKKRITCFEGAKAIWSLWPGYLPTSQNLIDFWKANNIPYEVHHASGHAHLKDLKRLAKAINPRRLVPIHSSAPERFQEFFENVEPHPDGEWWDV